MDQSINRVQQSQNTSQNSLQVLPDQTLLTHPSAPINGNPFDNENHDLIVRCGEIFNSPSQRYELVSKLGSGTFGQVYKARSLTSKRHVAIKVVKNEPAYTNQAKVEIAQLKNANRFVDPDDDHHMVRLLDYFTHKNHLCLVFELLSHNLYELLKVNSYKGLSLKLVRIFIKQLLETLILLREHRIAHCDLKPENVLLQSQHDAAIKLIDFGSACHESKTMYTYIQSRFYRSPEVLLGHSYTTAIDMWSLGCIAMELFVGIPLFPGSSQHDVLSLIIQTIGCPPDSLLDKAKDTKNFFKVVEPSLGQSSAGKYKLRSLEEHREMVKLTIKEPEKKYHHDKKLSEIVDTYPYAGDAEKVLEERMRDKFLDFISGVLDIDPHTRWTPKQASRHPFITGEAFKGPFQPPNDNEIELPEAVKRTLEKSARLIHNLTTPSQSPPLQPFSPQELENAHIVAMNAARTAIEQFSPQNGYGMDIRGLPNPYSNNVGFPQSMPAGSQALPGQNNQSAGRSIPMAAPVPQYMGNPSRSQGLGFPGGQHRSQPYSSTYNVPNSGMNSLSDYAWLQGADYGQGGGRPGTSYSSYNTAMSNSFGVNSQYSYTPTSTLRSGMPSSSYGPSQSGFVSPRNVMGGGTSYGGSYMPSQSLQQAFTTFRQFGGVPPMPATSLDQMRVGWHPPHNLQTPHSLQRTSGPGSARAYPPSSNPVHQVASNGSMQQSYEAGMHFPQNTASQQDLNGLYPEDRSHAEARSQSRLYAERPIYSERNMSRRHSQELPSLQGGQSGRPPSGRSSVDYQSSHLPGFSEPVSRRFSRLMSGELEVFPEPGDWDPGYSDEQLLSSERNRQREIGVPRV